MSRAKYPFEPGFTIAEIVCLPYLSTCVRWHFESLEQVPEVGPAIVAANHLSIFDGLAVGYAVLRAGRRPRFLAKSSLFEAPVVGSVLASAGQIRVDRGTPQAPASLRHAEEALERGEVVVVFPEGTTTKAPDLAPLKPKSGVARLALRTGLSVIPCATWGGQWIWSYHLGIHPLPGKEVWVRFGQPRSFKEFSGKEDDPGAWTEVAASVMEDIEVLTAGLRAAKPWTPKPLLPRYERRLRKKGRIP